jgi:hypothetical protein
VVVFFPGGVGVISYSTLPGLRPTRLALMFRSSPAIAMLSSATSAVKWWMPAWRARPNSRVSSSLPSLRPCQLSMMVTAIPVACGSSACRM